MLSILEDSRLRRPQQIESTEGLLTVCQSRATESFVTSNTLTNLVKKTTNFPPTPSYFSNSLNIFLPIDPWGHSDQTSTYYPLRLPDHGFITFFRQSMTHQKNVHTEPFSITDLPTGMVRDLLLSKWSHSNCSESYIRGRVH